MTELLFFDFQPLALGFNFQGNEITLLTCNTLSKQLVLSKKQSRDFSRRDSLNYKLFFFIYFFYFHVLSLISEY